MTLNKFCVGIANNTESNMFQYGYTPLNILSCQFRACLCRKLWNYWWCLKQQGAFVKTVKQILRWDCQQFWIQHVPIWEHPLEYLSRQFRACLCRKLWNYWWCLKQQGAIVKWIQHAEFMTRAQNICFLLEGVSFSKRILIPSKGSQVPRNRFPRGSQDIPPKQGSQEQIPKQMFPATIPPQEVPSKVPRKRFPSKGSQKEVLKHGSRFPATGSQEQVPKQVSQEQVHK